MENLFGKFEKLLAISVCGVNCEVPENNNLLRCFQFLALESVSMGDFCWNGDCANCHIWLETTDASGAKSERKVLACRTMVEENMKIVKVAKSVRLK
ncbi:MAG: hypothetical protein H7Z37_06625 [Pyrinomonadaceae bacterium]|nr:hypothetical protein [Pyrinomonadaceae bacterium]